MLYRGQLWTKTRKSSILTDPFSDIFIVTGTGEDWVWYMGLSSPTNMFYSSRGRESRFLTKSNWSKARPEHFEKNFEFSHSAIARGVYWKKRATGEFVEIAAVRDNGYSDMTVFFDLDAAPLRQFYEYFAPCTREESRHARQIIRKKRNELKNLVRTTPGRRI